MAGFAAIVYLGYFGSVQADAASGSELIDVVTAVVLGGVDIFGGSGTMVGVLLALILISVLRNGMQLANLERLDAGHRHRRAARSERFSSATSLRAAQGRSFRSGEPRGPREEVNRPENDSAVHPSEAMSNHDQGG